MAKTSIAVRSYDAIKRTIFFVLIPILTGSGSLGASFTSLALFVGFLSVYLVTVVGWEYFYWKRFEYDITEAHVTVRSGVISHKRVEVPLERVQNVNINQSFVQRIIGLSKVDFETAGGKKTEASLKYITKDQADEVQKTIRELKEGKSTSREVEESEEFPDFTLEFSDLALLSATSLDARAMGVIFTGLGLTGGVIGSTIDNLFAGWAAVIVLGVAGLVTVWAGSFLSTVFRYFDFRLDISQRSLEYQRGLFNRSSGSIPFDKIQSVVVKDNIMKRYLGYATLEVETAGYSQEQQQQLKQTEIIIPMAKMARIEEFAEKIGGFQPPREYSPVADNAVSRYTRRYILLSGVMAAFMVPGAYLWSPVRLLLLIPAALLVLSRKAAHLKYQNLGYSLEEKHLYVKNGFWARNIFSVPYYRTQNIHVTESPFQRRWSQSSVVVDTAGSPSTNPHIPDMERTEAKKLSERLLESFRVSLE